MFPSRRRRSSSSSKQQQQQQCVASHRETVTTITPKSISIEKSSKPVSSLELVKG
jgi:hypothetical protein